MKLHNERPTIHCNECSQTFTTKNNLDRHIKRKHNRHKKGPENNLVEAVSSLEETESPQKLLENNDDPKIDLVEKHI